MIKRKAGALFLSIILIFSTIAFIIPLEKVEAGGDEGCKLTISPTNKPLMDFYRLGESFKLTWSLLGECVGMEIENGGLFMNGEIVSFNKESAEKGSYDFVYGIGGFSPESAGEYTLSLKIRGKKGEDILIADCFASFTLTGEGITPPSLQPPEAPETGISALGLLPICEKLKGLIPGIGDKEKEEEIEKEIEKTIKDIEEKKITPEEGKEKLEDLQDEINGEIEQAKKEAAEKKRKAIQDAGDVIDKIFTIWSIAWGTVVGFQLGSRAGICSPEQPLSADLSECDSCNDPGMFCIRERCEILGENCYAVPTEEADRVLCLEADCLTMGRPKITNMEAKAYIDLTGSPIAEDSFGGGNEGGITGLAPSGKTELPWNVTTLDLDIEAEAQTDPKSLYTHCRWSFEKGIGFDEMTGFDEPLDLFGSSHSVRIDLSNLAPNADHEIWIKCKDVCGAVPAPEENPYYVKFRKGPEPDFVPPCYPDFASAHDAGKCLIDPWQVYVPADLTSQEVSFLLDKNDAECAYSTSDDNFTTDWDEMHPFGESSLPMIISSGYTNTNCLLTTEKCTKARLTLDLTDGERMDLNITAEDLLEIDSTLTTQEIEDILALMEMFQYTGEVGLFHFVIKCRNKYGYESEPLDYVLLTMPPYDLVIEQPSDPLEDPYDVHPPISVNTTHNTQCKYAVTSPLIQEAPPWDNMTFIDEDYDIIHIGSVEEELEGGVINPRTYTFWAKCRDEGRLEVINSTSFSLLKDVNSPFVVRMYHATDTNFGGFGDNLVIETDEPSECVYGIENCNYNFTDGTSFTKDEDGYLHAAYWQTNDLYYIKCKDKWDNYPGPVINQGTIDPAAPFCTTIINPYEVPAI